MTVNDSKEEPRANQFVVAGGDFCRRNVPGIGAISDRSRLLPRRTELVRGYPLTLFACKMIGNGGSRQRSLPMPKYQVAIIRWPEKWKPECADDVPLELQGPVEVLAESDRPVHGLGSGDRTQREPRGATPQPLGGRGRAGRRGPGLACRPTLHADHLQGHRHLVARRLGTQFSAGRAQLRLEVARAGRRRVVRLSAGRGHRVGAESAVHGPSRRRTGTSSWRSRTSRLTHGLARSVRHRDHGRGPPHARHSARTGRPRRVFALSRPRLRVCQGRLVEPDAADVGPSQPGVRSDGHVGRGVCPPG